MAQFGNSLEQYYALSQVVQRIEVPHPTPNDLEGSRGAGEALMY